MTKRDLVVKIAEETGFIQSDVANVVQCTLDFIAADLMAGNTIELRNFGVFEIKAVFFLFFGDIFRNFHK